ncbi:hypothetical protein [Nesterenkonia cremea]|uniref:Uncharacterized protein n=1 Tax=Nesterenkonia cremea TaxID=1882340 RepID=A0A917ARF9_9MICC|nr:hypothetical protein [Nesterenkonia cremea]GGE68562.1 hypothetical protein GCM10011401_14920 [Nesterenkonia cremea]
MAITLLVWLAAIIAGVTIGTVLCWRIERSGVERWGASGRLYGTGRSEAELQAGEAS